MPGRRAVPPSSETGRAVRGLLLPCLMIQGGRIVLPTPDGPLPARDADGKLFDVLEVSDQLSERYGRMYVIDLDGWDRDEPQLDYLQEIARSAEVWVDAGVRSGEQAIDVVVAGAFRTVLSTAHLESERELRTAWKLSPEIAFEVRLSKGQLLSASGDWTGRSPSTLGQMARAVGVQDVVYSPTEQPVDWATVKELSGAGPVWVGGSFRFEQLDELQRSGATGGIFQLYDELGTPLAEDHRDADS